MKVLKEVFRFYRFLVWKSLSYTQISNLTAKSIQGKFLVSKAAIKANDLFYQIS